MKTLSNAIHEHDFSINCCSICSICSIWMLSFHVFWKRGFPLKMCITDFTNNPMRFCSMSDFFMCFKDSFCSKFFETDVTFYFVRVVFFLVVPLVLSHWSEYFPTFAACLGFTEVVTESRPVGGCKTEKEINVQLITYKSNATYDMCGILLWQTLYINEICTHIVFSSAQKVNDE